MLLKYIILDIYGLLVHVYHLVKLCQCFPSPLEVWMTIANTQEKLLSREAPLQPVPTPEGVFRLRVDRNDRDQEMKGFGAAITGASAYLIYTSPEKEDILQDLFSVETGLGISYIRITMGASDFNAREPYTYDDMPPGEKDFDMTHFSIENDREFIIPCLRDIIRVNPQVKIMASPWSAPGWMKDIDRLYGGTMIYGQEYYEALAEYFVRFLKAYRYEGIDIDTVTLQNEPMHENDGYPTMFMWPQQQMAVIRALGPRLQEEELNTGIITWDHNWDGTWYPQEVLSDPVTRQYVAGHAWHCYNGDRYDPLTIRNQFPDQDVYFTECSGGLWRPGWDESFDFFIRLLVIGQSRVGARAILLWNMALDENRGPTNVPGGCKTCYGVVTIPSGQRPGYSKPHSEYYSLAHVSKFVRQGARRISITTIAEHWLETVAFENSDGSVTMIIWNRSPDDVKSFDLEIDGSWYHYDLPIRTCLTLIKR